MGKYDGYLICSDFDGTIYIDQKISQENIDAIAYFQSEGGYFTFASGRNYEMFTEGAASVITPRTMSMMPEDSSPYACDFSRISLDTSEITNE